MADSKRTRCIRIAFRIGYRVTDEGGVVAPSGRRLLVNANDAGYFHFSMTTHVADRERYGLPRAARVPVHRLAAYQLFGEDALQFGTDTRHLNGDRLDNRLVNIAIGTRSDNMMDRPAHARKAHAMKAACSPRRTRRKLTDDQVREIRKRLAAGESARALAKVFAVAKGTINNIMYGRSYKEII